MSVHTISEEQTERFNKHVTHPLQTFEWGAFREKTGIKVIRFFEKDKGFQMTIHKIPHTNWTIGYLPKCDSLDQDVLIKLKEIAQEEKCIFIQLEPNIIQKRYTAKGEAIALSNEQEAKEFEELASNTAAIKPASHPLFTQHTFVFDLTKTESELLAAMHPKTRYNIRVAQKHNIEVVHDNSNEAFDIFQTLTEETTGRQGFYAHSKEYREKMWAILRTMDYEELTMNELSAHLLIANYRPETKDQRPIPLVAWVLFVFKDTLYYPYGASSSQYKEAMASTTMMWEAIKFGKKMNLKKFDMWGSLGPQPDPKDPWYGFHRFKQGFSPTLVEFVGSYDFVINPLQYKLFVMANKLRWAILKLKK